MSNGWAISDCRKRGGVGREMGRRKGDVSGTSRTGDPAAACGGIGQGSATPQPWRKTSRGLARPSHSSSPSNYQNPAEKKKRLGADGDNRLVRWPLLPRNPEKGKCIYKRTGTRTDGPSPFPVHSVYPAAACLLMARQRGAAIFVCQDGMWEGK